MDKLPTFMQAFERVLVDFASHLGSFLPLWIMAFCMENPQKSVLIARDCKCAYKIHISSPLLFDSLTETKQILITGSDDQAPKMELLERNGSSTICQASSFKYPIDVEYASGALVGTTMVSCGGYGDGTTYDSCYKFDKQNNQWTFLSKMSIPRTGSAAISVHNGVWITGGQAHRGIYPSNHFKIM